MDVIDNYSYISGMASACYLLVCLICGMHLCWNVFSHKTPNPALSRLLGVLFLIVACGNVFYVLADLTEETDLLYNIGNAFDFLLFIGGANIIYFIYCNNQPPRRGIIILSIPFAVLGVIYLCVPELQEIMVNLAAVALFLLYVYFVVMLRRRERHLEDIYADPESHSLRWIWIILVMVFGWWMIRTLITFAGLTEWRDSAVCVYMSILIVYASFKVSRYGTPVPLEVQEQIENMEPRIADEGDVSQMQQDFMALIEKRQIFLDPDLTVNDVAKMLGTNAKTFSAMLHNEMNTSFSSVINGYRVEKAKELLQHDDEKVVNLAPQCGFNSNPVFFRTFSKVTGETPAEWRKNRQLQK